LPQFDTEWLPQLVEALPVGVFILDAAGDAVYANAAAQELLGRRVSEGDHAENLRERYAAYVAGTNEPYPTHRMPVVRALAGERAHVDDMEIERDGKRVALDVTATPILDEAKRVVSAVAVFQDITA
jgi:PAS domain S-box-containing protein